MTKTFSITLVGLIFLFSFSIPKENPETIELYERDVKEIKSKARSLINELEALLNLVSNSDVYQSEVVEVLENSFTQNNVNRIFKNEKIIVEDDLDPDVMSSAQAQNIDVKFYLSNFNLLYEKTADYSVSFSEVKVSDIYFKDYLFLTVQFNRNYKSTSRRYAGEYPEATRVAELEVIKDPKGGWEVFVVGLRFASSVENIQKQYLVEVMAPEVKDVVQESDIQVEEDSPSEDENITTVFYVVEDELTEAYNQYMAAGNRAFKDGRYEDAIEQFSEAREIRQNDPLSTSMRGKAQSNLNAQLKLNTSDLVKVYENQGDILVYRSEFDLAIKSYERALKLNSSDAQLSTKLDELKNRKEISDEVAKYFLSYGGNPGSRELQKLSRKNPKSPDYKLGLAEAYLVERDSTEDVRRSREIKSSMIALNDALDLEPNFKEALIQRAELYGILEEYDKAFEQFQVLIEIEKDEPDLYYRRALVKLTALDSTAAIEDLNMALSLNGNDVKYNFELGKIYYNKKEFREASKFFGRASLLDRNNAAYYYYMGLAQAEFDLESAVENLITAKELGTSDLEPNILAQYHILVEKNYVLRETLGREEALKNINTILALQVNSSLGMFRKGQLLKELRRFLEAKATFEEILEEEEGSKKVSLELAEVFYLIGDYESSMAIFSDLEAFFSSKKSLMSSYSVYLIRIYNGQGDNRMAVENYESAHEYYLKSLNISSSLPEIYLRLGNSQLGLDEPKEASKYFSDGIKLFPDQAELLFQRGIARYLEGSFDDSKSDFEQSKGLEFKLAESNYYLGLVAVEEDNPGLALKYLQDAVAIAPLEFKFYPPYFMLNLFSGEMETAKSAIVQMNQIKVESSLESEFAQGIYWLNEGDLSKTNQILNGLMAKYPTDGDALFLSGLLFYEEGKEDLALKNLERSFETGSLQRYQVLCNPVFLKILSDKKINRLRKQYFK